MRKYCYLLLLLLVSSSISAQYTTNGYYRVRNVATSRYIYVLDNTGSIKVETTSADMGAIELYKDTARKSYDPACIMYVQKVAEGKYDIKAQGTGVHDIIGYYVDVYDKGNNQYQVYAEGKYLDDNETSTRDLGFLGTERTGQYRLWNVLPMNSSTDYFGIKPTLQLNEKYYKPYYVSFPFSLEGTGMKAYYISKIYQSAVILKEISGVIPPSTPIFIECSSANPWNNKINLQLSSSQSVSNNQLKGAYFYNPGRQKSKDARTAFNPALMRVLTCTDKGLAFTKDCSKLPYDSKSKVYFLAANESYLPVPSTVNDTLYVMTEEEYALFSTIQCLTLGEKSVELFEGESITLTPTILPITALNKTLKWISSDTVIATVSQNGEVLAKKQGIVSITATTTDGSNLSVSCQIVVKPIIVSSLVLSKGNSSAVVGDTIVLSALILPFNASNQKLNWESSNEEIASVNNGVVVIKNVGTTLITASTTDGSSLSAQCLIVGQPLLISSLLLRTNTLTLDVNDTIRLIPEILPINATYQKLQWTSSNNRIATVNDGFVTALSAGDVLISASSTDGTELTATCLIHVNPLLVKSLTLDTDHLELNEGDSALLSATCLPINATNTALTWTSANLDIAQVINGKVTANHVGKTIITVSTLDGSQLSSQCEVTVLPIIATGITLNKSVISAIEGYEEQLSVTFVPNNVTTKKVIWTTSDSTIVKVDNNGLIHIQKVGSAIVRATTTDGSNLSAECTITGNPIIANAIHFPQDSLVLEINDTIDFMPIISPTNATSQSYGLQSLNENIVGISANKIVARTAGKTAIITFTTDGSNLTDTCWITVMPTLVKDIILSDTLVELYIGEEYFLKADIFPTFATNKNVEWQIQDTSIVQIQEGNILAIGVGETILKVVALDGSQVFAECRIVVKPILAQQLTLSNSQLLVHIGDTAFIQAYVYPENTTNAKVTWSIENEDIVRISDGQIIAIGVGETTVTAMTIDGSNLSVSCRIISNPILAQSITLNHTEEILTIGDSLLLEATILPISTTNKEVIWYSENPQIIQVVDGMIKAVGIGETTVIVMTIDGSNLTATCDVVVNPIFVERIELNTNDLKLYEGENFMLKAIVYPQNATFKEVNWSSEDESIVSVSQDGKISAKNEGETQITASAKDNSNVSATCEVKVMIFSSLMDAVKNNEIKNIYDILGRKVTQINSSGWYIVDGRVIMVVL